MPRFLLLFLLVLVLFPSSVPAEETVVVTGLRPPYAYNKGLHMAGVAVDTYETIMKMTGTPFNRKDIKLVQWRVALGQTAFKKNRALLVVERKPEYEKLFKWVGPIDFPHYVLIGRKGSDIKIETLADATQYSIGAVRKSDPALAAVAAGLPESALTLNSSYVQPMLQLKKGEIDLLVHSDMAAAYQMRKMGMDQDDFDVFYTIKKPPLYFAFSKDSDDATIKLLNEALSMYKRPMVGAHTAYDQSVYKHLPKGPVE